MRRLLSVVETDIADFRQTVEELLLCGLKLGGRLLLFFNFSQPHLVVSEDALVDVSTYGVVVVVVLEELFVDELKPTHALTPLAVLALDLLVFPQLEFGLCLI